MVNGVKAQKKVILIDSCNSGAFLEDQQLSFNLDGASRGIEMKTAMARFMRATGVAIFLVDRPAAAWEGYGVGDDKHGLFTYALLRGLAGEADVAEADGGRPDGGSPRPSCGATSRRRCRSSAGRRIGIEQLPMSDLKGQNFPIATLP